MGGRKQPQPGPSPLTTGLQPSLELQQQQQQRLFWPGRLCTLTSVCKCAAGAAAHVGPSRGGGGGPGGAVRGPEQRGSGLSSGLGGMGSLRSPLQLPLSKLLSWLGLGERGLGLGQDQVGQGPWNLQEPLKLFPERGAGKGRDTGKGMDRDASKREGCRQGRD